MLAQSNHELVTQLIFPSKSFSFIKFKWISNDKTYSKFIISYTTLGKTHFQIIFIKSYSHIGLSNNTKSVPQFSYNFCF
jgi:hypothetical protein